MTAHLSMKSQVQEERGKALSPPSRRGRWAL